MSAHSTPLSVQPSIGPVRSRRGLVDVDVLPDALVLRAHDSWRDWFDSELVVGLVALLGIAVALAGLVVGGPLGIALVVLGVLLVLPAIAAIVVTYAAMAFFAVQTVVRLLTRTGRSRLKREAAGALARFGEVEHWHIPRAQVAPIGPVELGRRARLRLDTPSGELVLSTPRRHHARLEAVAWALQSR